MKNKTTNENIGTLVDGLPIYLAMILVFSKLSNVDMVKILESIKNPVT